MKQYLDLLQYVMDNGNDRGDRTGTGTRSVFGYQMRFDIGESFPLVTTKKVFFRGVVQELLWFLRGETNIKYLVDKGINIWNEWPARKYAAALGVDFKDLEENERGEFVKDFAAKIKADDDFAEDWGDLGPVYGKQWRKWVGADGWINDQIETAVETLRNNPESRRIIVSAWNVSELADMALTPCHCFFQFYTRDVGAARRKLDCQMYIRSNDLLLGCPFNIAGYSLLTMMIAQICDMDPGELIYTIGDAHIYENHFKQVRRQLEREPYPLPMVALNPEIRNIDDFKEEDITLIDYKSHKGIRAPIAV